MNYLFETIITILFIIFFIFNTFNICNCYDTSHNSIPDNL